MSFKDRKACYRRGIQRAVLKHNRKDVCMKRSYRASMCEIRNLKNQEVRWEKREENIVNNEKRYGEKISGDYSKKMRKNKADCCSS
ncbi:MAG: hypothetical protein P1P82_02635 [Bacteroidales bacterium]|nr:hypothetical protein [Bacteroidales bacterium]MDT8431057.1 hypothetical protein [Bacteroidales bacterium]